MQAVEKKLKILEEKKYLIEKEIEILKKQIEDKNNIDINKKFTKNEKIEIFKSLFISRFDIYAKKWISKDKLKEGFFPATNTFQGEDYLPLTNLEIEDHLRGNIFLATYPINKNNMSKFVAFEISNNDKFQFQQTLSLLNLKGYYELNSYNSIVVWIFFEEEISSSIAFNFSLFILKKANINAKIYPNKEFSTKENLGNCIELPLNLKYRNKNRTIFIDEKTNKVFDNQWYFLSKIMKLKKDIVYKLSQISLENKTKENNKQIIFPIDEIKMIIHDYIYIPTQNLSKSLISKFKSFATFENPQIKLLASLRKPYYNTPKFIKSFEENEKYLLLPRGLKNTIDSFLMSNNISFSYTDKRIFIKVETRKLLLRLRPEQNDAIREIKKNDYSICVAPPGFGKTLIAAKIFEDRNCNTLIVVNKNMLLNQWIERFIEYFNYSKKEIGYLGKSQNKLNGIIDIATMQSLKNHINIIKNYSLVVVDECHHIPALTFEQIIKNFKGKYILGLSATPNRKDGLQPILFQQLGNISYEYKKIKILTNKLEIIKTNFKSNSSNYSTLLNEICINKDRNKLIIEAIKNKINRKILLLTDRIEHINILETMLKNEKIDFVSIHGSQNKKEQVKNMNQVLTKSLILATSSYFGEGIDFPHLNTILFATPISYYGRLIQYLGRIGRGNQECLAIDILDSQNAILNSSYKKRAEGYRQMHYIV